MPVLAIERETSLCIVPTERGKAALDCGNGIGLGSSLGRPGGAGGNIEPNGLWLWWEGNQVGPPAPSGKMLPVRGISLAGIGGTGGFDVTPGTIS